jgi:hypothetical protein
VADRYCRNCGHELAEDDRFCPNCGRPVHETAHVPTPKAEVEVPPPPHQEAEDAAASQTPQAATPSARRSATAGRLFVGCLVVAFALFALFAGATILGGGGGGGSEAGGSGESDGAGKEKQPLIRCNVAASCDLGESTVTITRAKATDLISTSMDNFEGDFMLVEFDYTYGGAQPATVQEYNWKLEDSKGRTYRYAFDPTSTYEIDQERSLIYEKINPGTKNPGAIIFEVAPDAKNFTLYIKDLIRPKSSKQAKVDL